MKTLFATALVMLMMLASTPTVCAYDGQIYLNPGFKLGYTFGNHGGFTYGFEVSVTTNFDNQQTAVWSGLVVGVDFCKDWTRLHTGVEASAMGFGFDVGPSFLYRNDTVSYGTSFIPFIGFGLYPYYNLSYFDNGFETREIGSYAKAGYLISGDKIHIHM